MSDTRRSGHRLDSSMSWLAVSPTPAIAVEHPCFVKNPDKAIDMLGGSAAVLRSLQKPHEAAFALSFRPDDPTSRSILSNSKKAHNVLLRIELPKRTGRKRKRGSTAPFQNDPSTPATPRRDAEYLLRSMTDNRNAYTVSAVNHIPQTHIWRTMPDLVYSTAATKIVQDVKDKVMSQQYTDLKSFHLPRTYGLQNTETVPPAIWSTETLPRNYMYRQNPAVKMVDDPDTGKRVLKTNWMASKIYSYQLQWDTPECPKEPMPGIPPLEGQSSLFQAGVRHLHLLFNERPVWTRRALLNQIKDELISANSVRFAIAYVAYAVRSGPWRDTYIKLGVDPRIHPQYRFYQTIMLQLVPKENPVSKPILQTIDEDPQTLRAQSVAEIRQNYQRSWAQSKDTKSHLFTGFDPIPPDGKVWQLCDILDPQLRTLIDIHESGLRSECETRYFGWYKNGTNAKIRVAMKAKVDALIESRSIHDVNVELQPFLSLLPEEITEHNDPSHSAKDLDDPTVGYLDSTIYTRQQLDWAAAYRTFARTGPGKVPYANVIGPKKQQPVRPPTINDFARRRLEVDRQSEEQSIRRDTSMHAIEQDTAETIPQIDPHLTLAEADSLTHIYAPEHATSNEIMPSIEPYIDGFGDDELDLDLDFDIKMEEASDQDMTFSLAQHGHESPEINDDD